MADSDKEKRITEFMRVHNVDRALAEAMYAHESGESTGDVIISDGEDDNVTE